MSNEMNSNLARAHSLSDENVELIQQTFTHSEELSNMATTLKDWYDSLRFECIKLSV